MKKPELLAPAGTLEKLKFALAYGADAVYLGGKSFGLRAMGGNFTRDELKEGVDYAHALGRRVYVTLNIFPHDGDMRVLPDYLLYLQEIGVDAILVSDLGLLAVARRVAPGLEIHISTQASTVNLEAVRMWESLGASRVVLARELSLSEIRHIRAGTSAELEIFVHGAMCISYSGRCLLSSYLTGRDANRGACAQPCRWRYALVEEKRPGKFFPIEEDERGSFILNSKDMCLLPYLADVIESGVNSLKLEGRMKSVHYVASVTKAYREAIDAYFRGEREVKKEWLAELEKVSHRPYTTGFFYGRPDENDQIYGTSSYEQTSDFVGVVRGFDEATGLTLVEQRNHMRVGEEIEIFPPTGEGWRQQITEMLDEDGFPIDRAPHPQQLVKMRLKKRIPPLTILRRDV